MYHHIAATTTLLASSTSSNATTIPLTTTEALSGIFGSISLACWIFLLVPQLIENYRNQSAEAISLAFIVVWFIGDLANLLGALWASLVPTVIAIAVYFCFSDGLLISQYLYYGIRNKRREGRGLLGSVKDTIVTPDSERDQERRQRMSVDSIESAGETEPLLSRRHSRHDSVLTIPGSGDAKAIREQIKRRRSSTGAPDQTINTTNIASMGQATAHRRASSSTAAANSVQSESLAKILEEPSSAGTSSSPRQSVFYTVLKNTFAIFCILAVGTLGWLIAYKTGTWKPTPLPDPQTGVDPGATPADDTTWSGAQFLGYLSAVAYLGARLPQIWKNYRDKSCEGLSLLFFVLSLLGNATYGAGILFHSLEAEYVRRNMPWLVGSLGTMVEDVVIFVQFRLYRVEDDVGRDADVAVVEEGQGYRTANGSAERTADGDAVVVGQRL